MSNAQRLGLSLGLGLGLGLAAIVTLLDQVTKAGVLHGLGMQLGQSIPLLPVFSLTLVHNYGISLGMFQSHSNWGRYGLVLITVAIVIWLLRMLNTARSRAMSIALGLIIGGAVGNIIDRLRFGYVVDFLHAHAFGWSFYIFNVADAAISIGVFIWLLDTLRESRDKRARVNQVESS